MRFKLTDKHIVISRYYSGENRTLELLNILKRDYLYKWILFVNKRKGNFLCFTTNFFTAYYGHRVFVSYNQFNRYIDNVDDLKEDINVVKEKSDSSIYEDDEIFLLEEIGKNRIFSDVDPYGEEEWEQNENIKKLNIVRTYEEFSKRTPEEKYDLNLVEELLDDEHQWGKGLSQYYYKHFERSKFFKNPRDEYEYANQMNHYLLAIQKGREEQPEEI